MTLGWGGLGFCQFLIGGEVVKLKIPKGFSKKSDSQQNFQVGSFYYKIRTQDNWEMPDSIPRFSDFRSQINGPSLQKIFLL